MNKGGAYEAQPLTEELSHLSLRLWPLTVLVAQGQWMST